MKPNELSGLKKMSAERGVDEICSGMVVGLGHGSTLIHAVHRLGLLLAQGDLHNITTIAASPEIEQLARSLHIPMTDFDKNPVIDLTIDGADEVDPQLNLIKGGGGALLREKIIAQASKREVIIVDHSKLVAALGTSWAVPVEVVPFGWESHRGFFADLGASVTLRSGKDGQPFRTDQGNYILDCNFGVIAHPERVNAALNARSGIVEHGLFLGLATDVIVASPQGITHLERPVA